MNPQAPAGATGSRAWSCIHNEPPCPSLTCCRNTPDSCKRKPHEGGGQQRASALTAGLCDRSCRFRWGKMDKKSTPTLFEVRYKTWHARFNVAWIFWIYFASMQSMKPIEGVCKGEVLWNKLKRWLDKSFFLWEHLFHWQKSSVLFFVLILTLTGIQLRENCHFCSIHTNKQQLGSQSLLVESFSWFAWVLLWGVVELTQVWRTTGLCFLTTG